MKDEQNLPSQFVEITSYPYPNDPEMAIFRIELDIAGIEYFEKDSQTLALDPLLSSAIGGVKILVRAENEPEAHAILTEIRQRLGTAPSSSERGKGVILLLWAVIALIVLVLFWKAFLNN